MPTITIYDPRERANERAKEKRRLAREAIAIRRAKADSELEAQGLAKYFGITADDRPFLPGSSIRLAVGNIDAMTESDSVIGKKGLAGQVLAARTDFSVNIPSSGDYHLPIEHGMRVEIVPAERNRIFGFQYCYAVDQLRWHFIIELTHEIYDDVREFALDIDLIDHLPVALRATLEVFSGQLHSLPPVIDPYDLHFVGEIQGIRVGNGEQEAQDSADDSAG